MIKIGDDFTDQGNAKLFGEMMAAMMACEYTTKYDPANQTTSVHITPPKIAQGMEWTWESSFYGMTGCLDHGSRVTLAWFSPLGERDDDKQLWLSHYVHGGLGTQIAMNSSDAWLFAAGLACAHEELDEYVRKAHDMDVKAFRAEIDIRQDMVDAMQLTINDQGSRIDELNDELNAILLDDSKDGPPLPITGEPVHTEGE